jgi:hypothetical protein
VLARPGGGCQRFEEDHLDELSLPLGGGEAVSSVMNHELLCSDFSSRLCDGCVIA